MDKYGYEGESKFRPLSPWAYFGYGILFAIPVVGIILLIVFSVIDGNVNRKNFARSYFVALLIMVIALIVVAATGNLNVVIETLKANGVNLL